MQQSRRELPCLFLFFFSPLVVRDELASPGKMSRYDRGSMAAIHLGIGHITG